MIISSFSLFAAESAAPIPNLRVVKSVKQLQVNSAEQSSGKATVSLAPAINGQTSKPGNIHPVKTAPAVNIVPVAPNGQASVSSMVEAQKSPAISGSKLMQSINTTLKVAANMRLSETQQNTANSAPKEAAQKVGTTAQKIIAPTTPEVVLNKVESQPSKVKIVNAMATKPTENDARLNTLSHTLVQTPAPSVSIESVPADGHQKNSKSFPSLSVVVAPTNTLPFAIVEKRRKELGKPKSLSMI